MSDLKGEQMNKFLVIASISCALLSFPLLAFSGSNMIKNSDTIHTQKVGSGVSSFFYIVDTATQLCFASPGGGADLTAIDCQQLKNRSGWNKVITW